MRIKNFDSFEINENFTNSKEYSDYLKSNHKIKPSLFKDSLLEVSDIDGASVNYYYNVVDIKKRMINIEIEDIDYRLLHLVRISYKVSKDFNSKGFKNFLDNLNTIQTSIDEMTDRVLEEKSIKLWDSYVNVDKYSNDIIYTYEINFYENVNKYELEKHHGDWSNYNDDEYMDGLREVSDIYKSANINFDQGMEINDDGDFILIGFYYSDEIYVVATYNKVNKKFVIDEEELSTSIEHYYDDRN